MNLRRAISGLLVAAALLLANAPARAQNLHPIGSAGTPNTTPPQAQGVEVDEHLGDQVPLDLPFVNAEGEDVPLGAYFNQGKPVIVALVYYDCPIVCPIVMGKLTEAFKGIDFNIGDDYNVVFISIDPSEPASLAASAKTKYLANYHRPGADHVSDGWGFLTSPADSSRRLAESLGWVYKPIQNGEFSHPVCIFVLTPEGKIARYVYGVGYEPDTMRMALLEASDGKISQSIGDKIRLYCFRYDPSTGKYGMVAFRVVQLGGVLSMLVVGSLVTILLVKERIRHRRAHEGAGAGETPPAGTKS